MIGFMMFVFTIVAGVLVLVRGLQWIGRDHRTLESRREPSLPAVDMERIETALTRLEARLDDLQDQQRFLERLVARRQEERTLPPGSGDPEPGSGARERKPGSSSDSILFDIGD